MLTQKMNHEFELEGTHRVRTHADVLLLTLTLNFYLWPFNPKP